MSVTESVIRLESWKPILEWDENISGVPSYLEKDRQVILNARNEKYQTVEVTPEIIDKIRRLIEDDVAPAPAFAKAGITYNYYRTEKLGLREVIDRYYERKSRIYELDQMTETYKVYHNKNKLYGRLQMETGKSTYLISEAVRLHKLINGKKYYTYNAWKKRHGRGV